MPNMHAEAIEVIGRRSRALAAALTALTFQRVDVTEAVTDLQLLLSVAGQSPLSVEARLAKLEEQVLQLSEAAQAK